MDEVTTQAIPTIAQSLLQVMKDVGAVKKSGRNESQNFNFRGIDAVVNAVSPALQQNGIVVVPHVENYEYGTVEVGRNRTPMGHVRVTVVYSFIGQAGDAIAAKVVGEAMDSGDKATAKAMSVAFRTALLQALCLPTDEIDPDATSYERSAALVIDTRAISKGIAEAKDVETLAQIGSYITANKDHIEPTILETLRLSFKDAQSRIATAPLPSKDEVVETSTIVEEQPDESTSS